jgi:ssDNA-binding Zn-finger/Zn-ribbon topoisomerase 1
MGVIDDVRKWLKEIPLWQELEKIPQRTEELEARVTALEKALERVPGEACPKCGARAMRLEQTGRRLGSDTKSYRFGVWACTAPSCDHTEERMVTFR